MTEERDRAAYYQAHRDDDDVWGEPERSAESLDHHNLAATITVRFSPDEAADIRDLAREHRVSYSDVVRTAVRQLIQSTEEGPEREPSTRSGHTAHRALDR